MVSNETRTCKVSGDRFSVDQTEKELYERLGIPLPTLCPAERQRRRTAHRNFINLYYRNCSASKKRILSMYDADAPFPVYDNSIWYGDSWDAKDFGRDYDFNRPFFEQWRKLSAVVPRWALTTMQCENSDFANMTMYSRNCYMTFGCISSEDCMFGHIIWECQNCVDCLYAYQCQWCSNSTDIVGSYDVHYSTEAVNCSESYFLHDCRSCRNCFGCYNLRNKQYCMFNQQLSRSEYESRISLLLPLTADKAAELEQWLAAERKNHALFPGTVGTQCEDATGNHLYFSTELRDCFDAKRCESSRYCYTAEQMFKCFDISFSGGGLNRFCVDNLTITRCEEVVFSHYIIDSNNIALSQFCLSSSNLFGCIGIRNGTNCILNKQYSAEEYKSLRAKIIDQMRRTGEWGEFFPAAESPFAYNESIAGDYQPLSKLEALRRGLRWKDSLEAPAQAPAQACPADAIPQLASEAQPQILQQTFICPETGKPFKFIRPEIDFYRRTGLPLPRASFSARYRRRLANRGPRGSWERCCPLCSEKFQSALPQDRPEQVLCEPCYLSQTEETNALQSNGG